MLRQTFTKRNLMAPKYEVGQKVVIMPVNNQRVSPRGSTIEPYAGQTGRVTDYWWIDSNRGEVFYIYTVQVGVSDKEIVLHEDEIQAYMV